MKKNKRKATYFRLTDVPSDYLVFTTSNKPPYAFLLNHKQKQDIYKEMTQKICEMMEKITNDRHFIRYSKDLNDVEDNMYFLKSAMLSGIISALYNIVGLEYTTIIDVIERHCIHKSEIN